jgi:hypothetical protein
MSPSSFRFIVRTGPNPGAVFDLVGDVLMVGRDVSNDIVIADAEISRQHTRLTRTPDGYLLEDLGSTNGTFVNGERLMAPRVMSAGDLVGFGGTVTMTFDAVAPEAAATVARPVVEAPPQAQQPAAQPVAHAQPAAPAYTPTPAAPAQPQEAAGRRSRLPLAIAGGGCLALVVICALVLTFMPESWWCALLSPLTFLGYNFQGC